jgi:type VI secretion system protein ImpL
MVAGTLALLSVAWIGMYAGSLVDGRWQTWLIRVVVWAIGAVAAFLLLSLLRGFSDPHEKSEQDAIDDQLDQARRSLAAARIKGQAKLPSVMVLGPRGSAKTTLVLKSGLNAEHLAGNLYLDGGPASRGSGPPVAPTQALNLWYHEGHLLVEVAGGVAADSSRWSRLVRGTRPSRWIPALLGRPQSPRVAVVCYSMEELTRPGGSEAALASAKTLRDRLSELSKGFGIRLPVYVVFTKSDTIPHFTEFVENLTETEARQVLGATLRAVGEAPPGSFQERETARIGAAFEALYYSFAERRLDVLSRVGTAHKAGAVYEFPREFRKLSGVVAQFLVELCKPSQLGISPFLRGFYFTGVRPVELAADAVPEPVASVGHETPAGATRVFSMDQLRQHGQPGASPSHRRVPQWVFADRILRQVVLQDRVAMGMTTAGFGLNVLRRASLTFALAAVLVLGIGVIVGQARDRALRAEVQQAIAGVETVRSPDPALPAQVDLDRLDRLRRVTAQLSAYENGRRPLRGLMWLYSGGDVYPMAKRAYFDRFEKLLLNRARRAISATLSNLSTEPTLDERDRVYDALKAHVEMTDAPEEADSTFFAPVLTEFWAGLSVPQDSVGTLARAQFAFYGHELPFGNPFPGSANGLQVNTARSFLANNTSDDSFYQGLLSQANRLPSFALNRDMPETETYIVNTFEVPGAFTSAAWAEVTEALDNAERFFNRDLHVVGNEFYLTLDARGFNPAELTTTLRARYEADYAEAWTRFLASSTVVRHGLPQSERRLTEYGQPQSALFRMLSVIDENTRGKSPLLDEVFRAVQLMTGPDSVPQPFSAEYGSPYLERVRTLALAAGELNRSPGSVGAQDGLRSSASDGIGFVGNVQVALPAVPAHAGRVSEAIAELLRSPFDWARGAAASGTTIAANGLAEEFCSQQARVLRLYPFVSGAGVRPATWEDVHAFFGEGGSADAFFEEAEALGSLNAAYQDFKDRVGRVAGTFYPPPETSSPNFRIQVNFDGNDPIVLNVDGRSATFTATQRSGNTLAWDAARAERVSLVVQAASGPQPLEFNGTWGIFQLFHQADWQNLATGRARVSWRSLGISGDVRFQGEPLLDRRYFDSFSCPRRIAR